MSRIGKLPVDLPAGVTVTVGADNVVSVKGPLGQLSQQVDVKKFKKANLWIRLRTNWRKCRKPFVLYTKKLSRKCCNKIRQFPRRK